MERNDPKKAQGGFTLIEIIAVLVILGILAAVAVPRFLNMQQEARARGLGSLVSAAQSQLSMEYSRQLLRLDGDSAAAWLATDATPTCEQVTSDGWLADATLTCARAGSTHFTITANHANASNDATGRFTNPDN